MPSRWGNLEHWENPIWKIPVAVYQTSLPFNLLSRGKVRDIYDTPEGLLLVASDRLSAFDVVFPDPIPRKGEVLTKLSAWWFEQTKHIIPNHLISAEPAELLGIAKSHPESIGRCTLCKRTQPFPVECVVRGYLEGSGWNDYQSTQSVSGIKLPAGLKKSSRLPHPIFTPSTKAAAGHDETISFEQVVDTIGVDKAETLRTKAIELYSFAHGELLKKGIVVCDTKFEFGELDGEVILIDEALTPDSSRFAEAGTYHPGGEVRSLDKQYVRDYLNTLAWDKTPPAPHLPEEVIVNMTQRYLEIFERITGRKLEETVKQPCCEQR